MADTLLDAFVNVSVDPNSPVEQQLREMIQRLKVSFGEIGKSLSIGGVVNTDKALDSLGSVQDAIKKIQAQASQDVDFNLRAQIRDTQFRDEIKKLDIELDRLSVVAAGSLSGLDKVELANTRAQIRLAQAEIEKMNREVDKTDDLFDRIGAQQTNIDTLKRQMIGIYQGARIANGQMNNLNNNFFQLGQAIEDFSVGFELNGLKGGIRGAANNVSFLLNNLAQSAERSSAISATWKNIIALGGGIGAAVGILVIPRLVTWLQSLDDIEVKTVDITKKMEELARRAKIELEIRIGRLDFRDAVRELDGFNSAIDLLLDKSRELEREQVELFSNLRVSNLSEARADFGRALIDLNEVGKKGIKALQKAFEFQLNPFQLLPGIEENIEVPVPVDPVKLAKARDELKSFNDTFVEGIDRITAADKLVREFLDRGVVSPDQMKIVEEGISRIEKEAGRLAATGFISEEDLKKAVELIAVFRKDYEKLVDAAELFQKKNAELANQSLKALQAGTFRLTQEYQFQADVNAGRRREEERILFEHKQQTDELKEQLDLFKEIRKRAGDDDGVINQIAAESEKALLLQQQIDLQKRLNELRNDFPESRSGTADTFAIGVIGPKKPGEDVIAEMALLRAALEKNRLAIEGGQPAAAVGGAAGLFAPRTTADERRDRRIRFEPDVLEQRRRERRGGDRRGFVPISEERQEEIARNAAKREEEFERISAERKARRQEELERRKSGLPAEGPLTPGQQEAADQEELIRLQMERERIRERAKQARAEEERRRKEANDDFNAQRKKTQDELNERARQRAAEVPGIEGLRDRIRRIQERFDNRLKPGDPNPWEDPSLIRNQQDAAKASSELAAKLDKGLPFTSETIEKLLSESNRTLEAINTGIGKIDGTARLA